MSDWQVETDAVAIDMPVLSAELNELGAYAVYGLEFGQHARSLVGFSGSFLETFKERPSNTRQGRQGIASFVRDRGEPRVGEPVERLVMGWL